MNNQLIIETLKVVETGYKTWDDSDINKQIEAIYDCGYEWFEKDGKVGFKHSQSGLYLKTEGLHYYSPEQIKKTYEDIWSKNIDKVRIRGKRDKYLTKFIKSFLLTLLSLIGYLFVDKQVATRIFVVMALITVFNFINYMRLLNQTRITSGFYERQKNQNGT